MLRAILNKSWWQHPTRHQLYGHLPPITKTIQVRQTRHAVYCWRSRDELIRDVLLWTPTYGQAKAGWPARTYIQQICEDMGCSPKDLPEAMNDKKWWERVRAICASSTTRWWWYLKKISTEKYKISPLIFFNIQKVEDEQKFRWRDVSQCCFHVIFFYLMSFLSTCLSLKKFIPFCFSVFYLSIC